MLERLVRSKKSAGAFFAGASVFAGVLHYFYQVSAAKDLSQVAFGELSSWLAYISILLAVGVFFQFLSNFFPVTGASLKKALGMIMGFVFVGLLSPFLITNPNKVTIGIFVVSLGPIYSWLFGQLQIRQLFYGMGIAAISLGATKFSFGTLSIPGIDEELRYYWAIAISFCPTSLYMAILLYQDRISNIHHRAGSYRSKKQILNDLGSSITLSVLAALIPSMDIMIMDWSQDAETLGAYSRISLIYRGVFFSLFIFSQWLLPQQLSGESKPFNRLLLGWIKPLLIIFGLSLSVGLGAYLVAPLAASWLLGYEIEQYAIWIFFSCYNITVLKSAFMKLQELGSQSRPQKGYIFAMVLILELVFFSFIQVFDVSFYLVVVSLSHSLLLIFLFAPVNIFRIQVSKS